MHALVRARLQILLAAALFSTGGAAIKSSSLTSWQIACSRSLIAALVLMLVFPSWRKFWDRKSLMIGCAYAATMILYAVANKLTTAANTIFLQSTAPLYLLFLCPLLLKERARRTEWILTLTIGVGMILFFVGIEAPQRTAPNPALGNTLGALSGVTWALTLLGLRWIGREDLDGKIVGRSVVAGNLIAFLIALVPAVPFGEVAARDFMIVGYLGFFQVGLAYICVTFGVRKLPALETALLLLLEPVLNAFWAWAVHGETPGKWSLAGCSIILFASVLRAVGGRFRPAKAAETRTP